MRYAVHGAAILLPLAFFFSVLRQDATEPNGFSYLVYIGAVLVSAGLLTLGIGILRSLKVEVNP